MCMFHLPAKLGTPPHRKSRLNSCFLHMEGYGGQAGGYGGQAAKGNGDESSY